MSKYLDYKLLRHLKTVSEPVISPDDSRIVYVLSSIDANTLESQSRLVALNLADNTTEQLTLGNKDSGPKFSPNGKYLAFSRVTNNSKSQIMLLSLSGGEPRQITDQINGVLEFDWSPSSDKLVFSSLTPSEPQISNGSKDLPSLKFVSKLRYQFDTLGWRGNDYFHLFTINTDTLEQLQITDGPYDDSHPRWSPDDRSIAFISGRKPQNDFHALSEVYVAPCTGGIAEIWSGTLNSVSSISWAPSSTMLLAIGSTTPGYLSIWQGWIYTLEAHRQPTIHSDDSFRPCVGFPGLSSGPEIKWTSSTTATLLGESHGESYIFKINLENNVITRIGQGQMLASNICTTSDGTRSIIACSSPASPSELINMDTNSGTSNNLTAHNDVYMSQITSPSMDKFIISRADFDIECRTLYPPDFDPDSQYPLILDIHGGPNGAFYDSFVPWQQVFASDGYIVLAINPRGSSTYGENFMMSVINDWGGNDYLDLMYALDHMKTLGCVDPNRLGVHGYSYGGYMSSWMIGHTNRFKAAVVGAPCINLHSMYGTSDIGTSFGELQWGLSLDIKSSEEYITLANKLLSKSPITYATYVDTPTLLLHGESDHRCPISQSEEYFTTLKRLGKTVEMIRFPDCSHLFPRLGSPTMREAYLKHSIQWFNKHLKGD